MKTRLTLICFVCVTLLTPAYSAVKCIPHTSYPSCGTLSVEESQTDWSMDCDGFGSISGSSIVKGVGLCSNKFADTGTFSDSITFSKNASENVYCWCKMLSPVVSKWTSAGDYVSTYEDCALSCAASCTDLSMMISPFFFDSSFSD